MSIKYIFVICSQALFIQSVLGQCISRGAIDGTGFGPLSRCAGSSMASPAYGRLGAPALSYDRRAGLSGCDGYYAPSMEFTASAGGLPITSFSAISPTGISVISENTYEGPLSVFGELPFVSVVALDGALPSVGAGGIDYGCGSGFIGMLNDGMAPGAFASNGAFGSNGFGPGGAFAFGSGAAFAPAAGYAPTNRLGCGCGRGMTY